MEAFKGRGDGGMSSDFEDMVYVLNNRNAIQDEIEKSPAHLSVCTNLDYTEQKRTDFIV